MSWRYLLAVFRAWLAPWSRVRPDRRHVILPERPAQIEPTELVGGDFVAWVPLRKLAVIHLPRLRFKEGVVLCARHFRPEIVRILTAALREAPDGQEWVTVTEAWRYMRESRDLHNDFAAFDFSIRDIPATSESDQIDKAIRWAKRLRLSLGADYDVIFHDAGTGFHIHAEYDPKPAMSAIEV